MYNERVIFKNKRMEHGDNTQEDPVAEFAQSLLEEKNLENVDEVTREQMKVDLMDQVEDHVNAAILEHVPNEKLDEFERVIDSGDENAIRVFCQSTIPDLDAIVAKELADFRHQYLHG